MVVPSLEAVRITVQLLDQYKDEEVIEDAMKIGYKYQAPEEFLREHFAQNDYSDELQDDVAEFFFKILKYQKYLGIIEGVLLKEISPLALERSPELSERCSLNTVFLYLFIFELNELSKSKIEEIILSFSAERAFALLMVFKKSDTITKLYEFGVQIWDVDFVKEFLKNVFQRHLFEGVYETVKQRTRKPRIRAKKLTVPVGPKFSEHSRKNVPLPPPPPPLPPKTEFTPIITKIPVLKRANIVPETTYLRQSNSENLRKAFERNHEEGKKKYEEAQRNAFRCANVEKSEKFRRVVEQIEAEKCNVPVKKSSSNKIKFAEVNYPKKTAAVILREGARLLKLEQEEIKRYEHLARGGFNEDLILEWQKEIQEETFRKRMEDIEKKHLEVLLSYEEALISKRKHLMKKKESADEFRKEKENWLAQLEISKKEEQIRLQESIEKGKSYGKGAKEAMEHVREEKHRMALETMEESRALKERWLKEKEEDLRRKVQLIKEIKVLQAFGAVRRKQFDFSEPSGVGYLYEMSLAELKERLFIIKLEVQEELERRQAKVRMKRECRKEIIDSYQELIEDHQRIKEEQKQRSADDMRLEEKNKPKLTRSSSSLDCLRRKLYKKRRERIKHQIMC